MDIKNEIRVKSNISRIQSIVSKAVQESNNSKKDYTFINEEVIRYIIS